MLEYPGHYPVKRDTTAGTIRFKRKLLLLAKPLKQPPVGLEEIGDGIWWIYFNRVLLGRFDEREYVQHDQGTVRDVPGLRCPRCHRVLVFRFFRCGFGRELEGGRLGSSWTVS